MHLGTINMYEYKVFSTDVISDQGLNALLQEISHNGWEPIQIEWDKMQVFARKPLMLTD
jgi:hypothetical protein